MSERQPWLRAASGGSVPFGAVLRRTDVAETPSVPWGATRRTVSGAGTDPETGPGTGSELAQLRATVDAARAEGSERGRGEGLEETAMLRGRLAAAIAAAELACKTRDDVLAEQVVDLALGLCAELAPAAAAIDRRGLVQLVARSLADAGGARDLQLQVCAADAAVIGTQLPAGMNCTVRPELVPGEVWVEAPRLVVDGRWATRLAALREPLLALVRAAEPAFELAVPRGDA